jgi:hypothetical protein
MSESREYNLWKQMIQRCCNPKCKAFKNYGGRGIRVCERWRTSFDAFFQDMGSRPDGGLTLERVNNDGHYEPSNVKWASRKEQIANTRVTRERRVELGRINAMKRWHPESVSDR